MLLPFEDGAYCSARSAVYHCGSDLGWSDLFWFHTFDSLGPNWSPRIVIYGDMGNANAQSLPRLKQMPKKNLKQMWEIITLFFLCYYCM